MLQNLLITTLTAILLLVAYNVARPVTSAASANCAKLTQSLQNR